MARPLRVEYDGALYHVISRGDRAEPIVSDDYDRQRRLNWLCRVVNDHGWRLHAFALLTNHEHLFLETPQPNLSYGIKLLNQAYTQFFNKRHRRCGHLFQGRFKSHLIEEQGHYSEISRYIHLNPVRAKMVADPMEYRWSSFRGYCRAAGRLPWVTYKRVLADFGPGRQAVRRRRYAQFVRSAMGQEQEAPWHKAHHGFVIGSKEFLSQVKQRLGWKHVHPNVPLSQHLIDRPELDTVLGVLRQALGKACEAWQPGRRDESLGRALAAYVCQRSYGYRGRAIGRELGYRDGGAVTRAIVRVESNRGLLKRAKQLAKIVEQAVKNQEGRSTKR